MTERPKKIVILGGGLAACAAAFELTDQVGWKDRYEITLYQMGWRLGGKGASGRNRAMFDRIEEHGLHVFFGFYDNALRLMRRAYDELGRHPSAPLATFDDAFHGHDLVAVQDWVREGDWKNWYLPFPKRAGVPGEPAQGALDGWSMMRQMVGFMGTYVKTVLDGADDMITGRSNVEVELAQMKKALSGLAMPGGDGDTDLRFVDFTIERLEGLFTFESGVRSLFDVPSLLEVIEGLLSLVEARPIMKHFLLQAIGLLQKVLHAILDDGSSAPTFERRAAILLDMGIAVLRGLVDADLLRPGADWHAIDDVDYRDWLVANGARPDIRYSAPVRTLASAAFATGDKGPEFFGPPYPPADGGGAGAGTFVYLTLRLLLTYQGSVLYKMQAGMGDTIFGPLYEVLRRRGVRFEFFRRVDAVRPTADRQCIGEIVIGRQATVKGGREYRPLYDVKGLPCWPSEPLYDQLVEGEALRTGEVNLENWWTTWVDPAPSDTLRLGVDFDFAILGISIGAFPAVCADLVARTGTPFASMVANVKTTQTQAGQLWFRPSLEQLGWVGPSPITLPYEGDFDTWSDMSHLIAREGEVPGQPTGNIAYLCARLPDEKEHLDSRGRFVLPPRSATAYPLEEDVRVHANFRAWLEKYPRHLWPKAVQTNDPNVLNWDWLVDPEDRLGIGRLEAQYSVATWNPSDRYVMSVAGTTKYRLRSDESGYGNLVLAGDWTHNFVSAGCAECATVSGMEASKTLTGYPRTIAHDWLSDVKPWGTPFLDRTRVCGDLPPPPPPPPSPPPAGPARFIARDGDPLGLQPFLAEGATTHWFVFEADMAALQAMCDRYLNLGGRTYRPILPIVAFVAADVDKLHPEKPAFDKGWMAERDYAFWVPLVYTPGDGDTLGFGWFNPYMFVDSGVAANGGREIYGMAKSVSRVSGPKLAGDPAVWSVATHVIPKLYDDREVVLRELVRIAKKEGAGEGVLDPLAGGWSSFATLAPELFAAITAAVAALPGGVPVPIALLDDVLRVLLTGRIPIIALKQFPGVADAEFACYQGIVHTTSTLRSLTGGGLSLGDYEATIAYFESHEIVRTLGLQGATGPDGTTTLRVLLSWWIGMSFTLDAGEVVFQRPVQ